MLVRDIVEMCAQMVQLTLDAEVLKGEKALYEHPVCKHLVLCCDLIFEQLSKMFSNEPLEFRLEDLFQGFLLPDIKNADGTTAPSPITQEIFCCGVLAEYFFQTQDVVCFKMWNERYETELAKIRLSKKYKPLPVRRWI